MPKATTCIFGENRISVAEALRLRDEADRTGVDRPLFRCVECGNVVRPHKGGANGQQAHIEHWERNADCSLSDPKREYPGRR
jgi:hypothetical protein